MERQSEKKKKMEGWRLRTYKTRKSWMTRRGERTWKLEQKEKQGWRRPEEGGANNYRSSHVFKALLLSPLPVSKKKRERERKEGRWEEEDWRPGSFSPNQTTDSSHPHHTDADTLSLIYSLWFKDSLYPSRLCVSMCVCEYIYVCVFLCPPFNKYYS